MERDFKGVWIPKEIWLNENLSMLDKVIFAEINSLDNENHCTAGNNYLAEFCGVAEKSVTRSIKSLVDKGLISVESFDGRHRVLVSNVYLSKQTGQIVHADETKCPAINIDNNTNISSPTRKARKKKFFSHDCYEYKASAFLAKCVNERMPTCKQKGEAEIQRWASDFDKCHRIDGHSWDEIERVLIFSQEDFFWQTVILSGENFRKKYEQLLLKSEARNEKRT